jgi:L-ascorbate metabolism protein UlaG (beta-lactamase superfamily)
LLNSQGNKITWLGHSTFTVTTPSGGVVLFDPWTVGNPACPIALKKLPRVDIALISHGHSDHMDDVQSIASENKPQIICNYEIYTWLDSKGVTKVAPLQKGGTITIGEITISMVNAHHSSSIMDEGRIVYAGEPAGFVVKFPGGFKLYHAGDTCVFGDMKIIGDLYAPDVACLPIGDRFTMGPREAAYAIRLLGVRHVIPMHYHTFPLLTGTPDALREATKDIAGLEIHEMKPGGSIG